MILLLHRLPVIFIVLLVFLTTTCAVARNRVVVIPQPAKDYPPYAPVTAISPPTYAVGTDTVTDSVTDLVWQKTDDNVLYSWDEAWYECQHLNHAGETDWRLPSISELFSIVDYEKYSPAIKASFPSTNAAEFWSATTAASDSRKALYVNFFSGRISSASEVGSYYIRCVRRLSIYAKNYRNNSDGTVKDLATGLTWQRVDDNNDRGWTAATIYCDELNLGGEQNWRLPTVKELRSIVDDSIHNPAIDNSSFPGTNPTYYWSATPDDINSGAAWVVSFFSGGVSGFDKSFDGGYVRCVR